MKNIDMKVTFIFFFSSIVLSFLVRNAIFEGSTPVVVDITLLALLSVLAGYVYPKSEGKPLNKSGLFVAVLFFIAWEPLVSFFLDKEKPSNTVGVIDSEENQHNSHHEELKREHNNRTIQVSDVGTSELAYANSKQTVDITFPTQKPNIKSEQSTLTEREKSQVQSTTQDLVNAAIQGDWDSFMKSTKDLQDIESETLSVALMSAVQSDAPVEVVEEIISRGGELNFMVLHQLVVTDNIEMAKKLVDLGLDLHQTDTDGSNAILASLINYRSPRMFNYLLQNNVSVASSAAHEDALERVLLTALNSGSIKDYYLNKLIEYGSEPLPKHREIVDKIMIKNNDIYNFMRGAYPSLFA